MDSSTFGLCEFTFVLTRPVPAEFPAHQRRRATGPFSQRTFIVPLAIALALLRQDNERVTWFAPMKKLPKNLSPELEELRSGLIGALPLLGNELASMFGRPLPRLSARDKAGLEKKIDRLLRSTSPSLQKLEELKGKQVRCAQPPVALRTALMNTDSLKAYIRCTIVFALVSPT